MKSQEIAVKAAEPDKAKVKEMEALVKSTKEGIFYPKILYLYPKSI